MNLKNAYKIIDNANDYVLEQGELGQFPSLGTLDVSDTLKEQILEKVMLLISEYEDDTELSFIDETASWGYFIVTSDPEFYSNAKDVLDNRSVSEEVVSEDGTYVFVGRAEI